MFKKKKMEPTSNDDFFSDAGGAAEAEHEPMPDFESAPVKKQTPRSRVLLLLLLLVAIAGGGYFYLLPPVEEPPAPAPAPVRRPIPAQPAPAQQSASAEQPATAQPAAPAAAAKPAPTAAAKPAAAPVPAEKPATAPAAAPAPAAKETVAKPAKPAPTAEKAEPAAVAKPVPAAGGKYAIEAGAFLVKANRQAVEKTIGRLGYKAKITTVHRPVKMTRLRIGGEYTPMTAEQKLTELLPIVPTAFAVPDGERMYVYAGSFFLAEEARSVTDKLAGAGIQVTPEPADVKMPLELVTFGSFASREEASEALAKAKGAGLEAIIIRK